MYVSYRSLKESHRDSREKDSELSHFGNEQSVKIKASECVHH